MIWADSYNLLLEVLKMSDIDDALEEGYSSGDFEGEVWLSTDGKHTVRIKADNKDARTQGLKWAKIVYEKIVSRYGTKQAQAKKEYSKDNGKEKQNACQHNNTTVLTSKSPKNPGRKFYKCDDCGDFVGWVK